MESGRDCWQSGVNPATLIYGDKTGSKLDDDDDDPIPLSCFASLYNYLYLYLSHAFTPTKVNSPFKNSFQYGVELIYL